MLLEWVAISFSRGSSQPRDWTWVSRIAGRFFTDWATREATDLLISKLFVKVKVKIAQSCPTLCDPMDDKVHGILQARIPESVAFPFFRGFSQRRYCTQVSHIAGRFFTSWPTRESPYKPPCFHYLPICDFTSHLSSTLETIFFWLWSLSIITIN